MIPEQKIKTKWVGRTKNYYISNGYTFTKINDIFYVDIKDIQKNSNVKVKFICDYCKGKNQKEEKSKWKSYFELNKQRKIINKDCCEHINCVIKKRLESRENSEIPYDESVAGKYPELINEWSSKNSKTPYEVRYGSGKKYMWICLKGHEWKASVVNRGKGNGCPFCSSRKVCIDNCLATLNPELSSEWHPTKNGDLTPYDVTSKSNKQVWWLCKKGHESKSSPSYRQTRICSGCSERKVSNKNNLLKIYPKIAKEWHPTKNGNLTPDMVTKSSSKNIWWICEKGHEWQSTVNIRTSKERGCPYCCNRRVCLDNCLSTINPDLAKEWNYIKNVNITPNDITPYSSKKVWWKCLKGHEWEATVCNRSNGNNCPICNGSKGECRITNWLEVHDFNFTPQMEFDGLLGLGGGNLSYDFYLPEYNLLIEYQGEFHDGNGKEYLKINLEKQKEHDQRKREYAKKHNINLLEIWYWDYEIVEKILKDKIINLVV